MAMKQKELVPYIFEHEKFGKVRAINFKGEPLLVGRDIATALGYSNTKQALSLTTSPTSLSALSTPKHFNKWRQNQKVAK